MTAGATELVNRKAVSVADAGIGVLHIESHFPLVRGHLQNARSLGIPLQYACVRGVSPAQIVAGDPAVEGPLLSAATSLQDKGCQAIVGTCGSFVLFQSALVRAVDVPVFSSILLAVPLLLQTLKPEAKIGIMFASADSFSSRAREEASLVDKTSRLAIWEARGLPAFQPILANKRTLDSAALQAQVLAYLDNQLRRTGDIGMIVLQCSELAPYAHIIRQSFELPVFDINSLVQWLDISLFGNHGAYP